MVWETVYVTTAGPNGILARFISPGGVLGPVRLPGASTQLVSAPVFDKTARLGKAVTIGTAASTVTLTNIADGPALAANGAGDAVVVWNSAHQQHPGRHAGHADILRELIDGSAGLRPGSTNLPSTDLAWWEDYRSRLEQVAHSAGRA